MGPRTPGITVHRTFVADVVRASFADVGWEGGVAHVMALPLGEDNAGFECLLADNCLVGATLWERYGAQHSATLHDVIYGTAEIYLESK